MLRYPQDASLGLVSITCADLDRLLPDGWLNDNLIELGTRYPQIISMEGSTLTFLFE